MTSIYRDRLAAGWDKGLFFVAWFAGTAGLFLLKVLGTRGRYVIVWTAAVLLGYAFSIWRSPKFRVREDRAGDSCYYLGFLFTLSSLAYALWEFARFGNDPRLVIANFAVALSSTILGLVLRVTFQQFREDPFEVEQEVRLELSDAATRLKGELIQIVNEFGTLRTAIGQELRNEFTRAVTQIAKDCTEAVKASTEEHSKAVDASLKNIAASAESMKEQVASIRASSKETADAFERLAERLANVEIPTTALKEALATITKAANGTGVALQQVADHAKGFGDQIERIAAGTNEIALALADWKDQLDTGTKNWNEATKAERDAIKAQLQFIEQSAEALARLKNSLEAAVLQSQKAVVRTQGSLASLANTLVEQI